MRPVLVGQAPGPNTDPLEPLYPASASSAGGRLARQMGLSPEEYLDTFDRVNLLPEFPGKTSAGDDKLPGYEAKIAAGVLRRSLRGRTVILLGRGVARAWGGNIARDEFLTWVVDPHFGTQLACVPHPSGRTRWYNNPDNRDRVLSFWRALLATPGRTGEAVSTTERAA